MTKQDNSKQISIIYIHSGRKKIINLWLSIQEGKKDFEVIYATREENWAERGPEGPNPPVYISHNPLKSLLQLLVNAT